MKILVIRNEPPWPLCYGGRLHCYELCTRLAERHELMLVAERPGENNDWPFNFECRVALNNRLYDDAPDLTSAGFTANRWERFFGVNMAFARDVVKFAHEWAPDVVIGMNYQSLAYLARMQGMPTICDLQDDEALHNLLEFLNGNAHSRWQCFKGFLAALAYQRQHISKTSAVALNSETDRRFCSLHTRHPRIVTIAHGVDCDHYHPSDTPVDENRIIFWGGLAFGPNIGAILFFALKVWPLVRRQRPDLRWTILGRGDSGALAEIKRIPGIDFVGYVDDIRPHVARAAVAVVPMRSGAGIKNKIMEAWAMGKPVLCTPRALGDLPGVHGQNVWLAKSAGKLARGLIALLEDEALRDRIAGAGRRTALQRCSWDRAARQLEQLCVEVTQEKSGVRYEADLDSAKTHTRWQQTSVVEHEHQDGLSTF